MIGSILDVVSTTTAPARVDDAEGYDCHLFEAKIVDYRTPDPVNEPLKQRGKFITGKTIKVRNRFKQEMPVDQHLTVLVGHDGIGVVLVWEC